MSIDLSDNKRRLLPRAHPNSWVQVPTANDAPVRAKSASKIVEDATQVQQLSEYTDLYLADLLAEGIMQGHETKVQKIRNELKVRSWRFLRFPGEENLLNVSKGTALSEQNFNAITREAIRQARSLNRGIQPNALSHAQMAYWYTVSGGDEKALKQLRVSLALAPEFIPLLRTSTRLFIHLGEPEEGLHWLRRSTSLAYSPWLLAADIALSNVLERPQRNVKHAYRLSASGNYSDFNLSELHGALAMNELKNGADRRGKRLFTRALEDPTENVVAQAEWLTTNHGYPQIATVARRHLDVARAHEALALVYADRGDWDKSISEARKWVRLEPFSSRPYIHGSYHAATYLQDYSTSREFAEAGLRTQPDNLTLQNNLAFALAAEGKTEEARSQIAKAKNANALKSEEAMLNATYAWIQFCEGEPDKGDAKYRSVLNTAEHSQDFIARVLSFWALARLRANLNIAEQLNLLDKHLPNASKHTKRLAKNIITST